MSRFFGEFPYTVHVHIVRQLAGQKINFFDHYNRLSTTENSQEPGGDWACGAQWWRDHIPGSPDLRLVYIAHIHNILQGEFGINISFIAKVTTRVYSKSWDTLSYS